MPQKGILNFFSKKDEVKIESSASDDEGVSGTVSEEDEESLIVTQGPAKKRRVITDSDNEEETVKQMNTESSQSTSHKCTDIVGEEKIDNNKGETHVSIDGNMTLLKTPPKRATARKHTGKRACIPPSSFWSPATKKIKKDTTMETNSSVTETKLESEVSKDTTDMKEEVLKNVHPTQSEDDEEKTQQGNENKQELIQSKKQTEHNQHEDKLTSLDSNIQAGCKNLQEASRTVSVKEKSSLLRSTTGTYKSTNAEKCPQYDPSKTQYDPIEDACWSKDQKVPYLAIAKTFEQIEQVTGRIKIIGILANFLRSVITLSPQETVKCVYLCLNKLGPAYEGVELGIGDNILIKALSSATGRNPLQIKAEVAEKGDLGLVAEGSRTTQRTMFTPPPLTVVGVFNKLTDIAKLTGHSSQNKKVEIIKTLLVACKQSETKYLIRSLEGKLRIGLAEQSVLTALAHAIVHTPPSKEWPPQTIDASQGVNAEKFRKELESATAIVKNAYCELPNYDILIPALLEHGVDNLSSHCSLTPGIPLKPMLAHPTKGIQEVLQRFDQAEFSCEWKYDGERAQIHLLKNKEIQIYSRNQENNTSKYPDIIARMPKVINEGVWSFVIDAEAVAWDIEKKQILPFQILSTRKRKDANVSDIKVQVCVFPFDLLYINGESLVRETFRRRRELLKSSFKEIEGEFMFVQAIDTNNIEDIQTFMEESIKGYCEGLMVKTLDKDASYEIAKRSHNWLKLKKDYLDGVGDTLDLVVVGGFHGTGKRTGKYGGFLLACFDAENEEFQVICKIGTGFKDDQLDQHTEFFNNHIIDTPKPYYSYSDNVIPDRWFDAVQVWEVKTADLSISPVYPAAAGIVDPEKGISLRFPRFLRIRDDKKPEQATTSQQVADLYRQQQNTGKQSGETPELEDFY